MSVDSLRVVIAAGGVAALEATLALRALAEERVTIELVTPAKIVGRHLAPFLATKLGLSERLESPGGAGPGRPGPRRR